MVVGKSESDISEAELEELPSVDLAAAVECLGLREVVVEALLCHLLDEEGLVLELALDPVDHFFFFEQVVAVLVQLAEDVLH